MGRPDLIAKISVEDFLAYYWLKRELTAFCREQGLPTGGSKTALAQRIARFLETGEVERVRRSSPKASMPEQFTCATVVGPGWRCTQALRAFFEREIGPQFHFDGAMRDFIKRDGVGKTLQDAIDLWHEERSKPPAVKPIAPQFEYNRHIRQFFAEHDGATLQEAIAAWYEKRARRGSGSERE